MWWVDLVGLGLTGLDSGHGGRWDRTGRTGKTGQTEVRGFEMASRGDFTR